jgi:CHAT domain-containing protein
MDKAAHLIHPADDELKQYSPAPRQIAKRRRKFCFAGPYAQRKAVRKNWRNIRGAGFWHGSKRLRWFSLLFLGVFCFCVFFTPPAQGFPGIRLSSVAQATDATQLVNDGVTLYQNGDYQGAIDQWETALELYPPDQPSRDKAVLLENLARVHQYLGQLSESIDYWEQAKQNAEALNDVEHLGRLATEQAQTFSRLGQTQRAISLLCGSPSPNTPCLTNSAVGLARSIDDPLGETAALGSLGEALRLRGEYEWAVTILTESLDLAEALDQTDFQISALSSLGATYTSQAQVNYRRAESAELAGDQQDAQRLKAQGQADDRQAVEFFRAGQTLAVSQGNSIAELRSQLSLIPTYRRLGETAQALAAQESALQLLQTVPNSHEAVYATITLANLIQFGEQGDLSTVITQCFNTPPDQQSQHLLMQAVRQAQTLGDLRGEAFAWGALGHWHECQGNYARGLQFTQQAQGVADQQLQGQDSLYLWQWQVGRILLAQDKPAEAIQFYEQAVATLDRIRSDLLGSDRELQFDFRDTVEPIYRQLIALQLGEVAMTTKEVAQPVGKEDLPAALNTLESLKLAELQNYFGSDCEVVPFAQIQQGLVGANSATAVINSVLLGNRTAIIASFPSGERQVAWVPVDDATLRATINEYRRELERGIYEELNEFDLNLAQQVYDWLIRPFAEGLTANGVETLVFVNDGILRSIPMAALHNGERFLVEGYAIATIPTLSLTSATRLNPQEMQTLIMGLTESVTVENQRFSALRYVDDEVNAVQNLVPNTRLLLNQEFNLQQLAQELSNNLYSVLHMATHGQFEAEPEDTFLVTGQGEKLTLAEMERLIQTMSAGANAIDLLVLTACKTAIGDERAALGLAGVAVRSGAKSALASLWSINDAATARFSEQFYQGLVLGQLSKAKALQAAQVNLIQENNHPALWAPYILVGNWL